MQVGYKINDPGLFSHSKLESLPYLPDKVWSLNVADSTLNKSHMIDAVP